MTRSTRIATLVTAVAFILIAGVSPVAAVEPAPVNDNFADAGALTGEFGSVSATNVGATKEAGEPDHAGNSGGASVWYRWTAPRAGRAVFSTCGSGFDAVLAVYTGVALGSLAEIAANAGECASSASFAATAGTSYYVAVDGAAGATGNFYLEWFQRPANDDRADAQRVEGDAGSVAVSNRYASTEPGEPAHGGPGGASVWFRWTAPSAGPARFDTCGEGSDTLLAVYEGASTSAVAANDDYCGGGSLVGFAAEAGKEYLIAVDGYEGDWVAANLSWSRSAVPPSNRDRPEITGVAQEGETLTGSNGSWGGTPPFSFTYEWWWCNATATTCYAIPGATAPTYVLGPSDVGSRIRFWVQAANSAGWDAMNSAATAPVSPRPHTAPQNTAAPTITGSAVAGGTLSAATGSWTGYPRPAYRFEWQSCTASGAACISIPGANQARLTLSSAEVGDRIRVVVVATNDAGTASAGSPLTDVVRGPVRTPVRPRCVVPNVRGRSVQNAKAAILRSRCSLGRVRKAYSRTVRRGRVISQAPRAGARLRRGAKVNLLVSKGRKQ
jgi:hypothetical protein